MKTSIFLILTLFFISGCSSNRDMRERFAGNKIRILQDELGRKYIVQHHIGDAYTVTPYEPEK